MFPEMPVQCKGFRIGRVIQLLAKVVMVHSSRSVCQHRNQDCVPDCELIGMQNDSYQSKCNQNPWKALSF